jgi:serine/threonine-protein phosphatase PGAM5
VPRAHTSLPHRVKRSYGDVWFRHPDEVLPVRTLLFVRHGHYVFAEPRGLSPIGVKQAARVAVRLAKEQIDVIHYSTIRRAQETALAIAQKQPHVPLRPSTLLWEVNPPFYWPRRARKDELARRIEIIAQIREDDLRLEKIYEKFLCPAKDERTELVVCHGNVIRSVAVRVLGMRRQKLLPLLTRNTGITEIRIGANGVAMLCRYDDIGHLPPSLVTVT